MEESTKWVAARELSHRGLGQPHDAALPSESDTAVLGVYFEKITSLELPKVLAENTNKVTLRFFKSRLHLRNNTLKHSIKPHSYFAARSMDLSCHSMDELDVYFINSGSISLR